MIHVNFELKNAFNEKIKEGSNQYKILIISISLYFESEEFEITLQSTVAESLGV